MPYHLKLRVCAVALMLCLPFCGSFSAAQDGVVARVGEKNILQRDLDFAIADFGQELAQDAKKAAMATAVTMADSVIPCRSALGPSRPVNAGRVRSVRPKWLNRPAVNKPRPV